MQKWAYSEGFSDHLEISNVETWVEAIAKRLKEVSAWYAFDKRAKSLVIGLLVGLRFALVHR